MVFNRQHRWKAYPAEQWKIHEGNMGDIQEITNQQPKEKTIPNAGTK